MRSNYDLFPLFFHHLEMAGLCSRKGACSRPGCAVALQRYHLSGLRERVLRFHLHETDVLSHFFAQDFCAHSGIMTDCAVPTCRISFKTELKPVNIMSRFLQRAEPNLSIFADVGSGSLWHLLVDPNWIFNKNGNLSPSFSAHKSFWAVTCCLSLISVWARQTENIVRLCSEPCASKWPFLL